MRSRRFLAVALALTLLLCSALNSQAGQSGSTPGPFDAASIHLLAIASCPPWRPDFTNCGQDVAEFVDAARQSLGVPKGQITTLVDDEATAEAVRQTFDRLRRSLPDGSNIIVYYNGHGALVPNWGGEKGETQETFLLWSEAQPFAALYAVKTGLWMTGSELGDLVRSLPAKAALVILDTCNAMGAESGLISAPDRSDFAELGLMASSLAHEDAWFDDRQAIFTGNLVDAMQSGAPTLHDAFIIAKGATTAEAAALCHATATPGSPRQPCLPQDPVLIDPFGLTRQIKLKTD